jgi:intracellular septation protein A
MDFFITYFFTENINCEFLSLGFQPLNLFTSLAFFVVSYLLYRQGGTNRRMVALLIAVSGVASLAYHLWQVDFTTALDLLVATVASVVALALSYKNLSKTEWLAILAVGIAVMFSLVFGEGTCAFIPVGLHFIWHLASACLLYLLGRKIQGA